jgi:hypothetical protein
MGNVLPFNMHTLEEVHGEIPQAMRPNKKEFEKLIETHGLYRDLCGKKFMLDSDVTQLFEIIRRRPKEADLRGGPARLLAATYSPDALGYCVVIGDRLDREAPLFVGFAPRDGKGVSDLRKLVQYGYPGKVAVIEFCVSTMKEVEELRGRIAKAAIGGEGWYARTDEVTDTLMEMRSMEPSDDIEDETDNLAKGA